MLLKVYISERDPEYAQLRDFINYLSINNFTYTIEDIISIFEFVISPADKLVTGAIYTPKDIREVIINNTLKDVDINHLGRFKYADIACGCGGFLIDISSKIHNITGKAFYEIYKENIYGIDIQEYSIVRTKLILSFYALMMGEDDNFKFNLLTANTLTLNMDLIGKMDVIVGNPPYVCARNLSEESKAAIQKWEVCNSGNTDLYIPFIQIAIELLQDSGRMGYITMNTFLNSLNGRNLREYLSSCHYAIKIVDFRDTQIFRGKNTYTCLFFLEKTNSRSIEYFYNPKRVLNSFDFQKIEYSLLNSAEGWPLNDYSEILKVENVGTPLGEYCSSRHGIATLCNKVYVFEPVQENDNYYYFEKDGIRYKVEKGVCRNIINSNLLNSENSINDILEYVIYPYTISNGKASAIPEEEFRHCFPYAYEYLSIYRSKLADRDKGKGKNYHIWYEYGRTQSLVMPQYKLFFPKIANKRLNCILSSDKNLLLYNGMCFISDDITKLKILKQILESALFWQYVLKNSKPYSSGYLSLNGANIKRFGIPNFSENQIRKLLSLSSKSKIDTWLEKFY